METNDEDIVHATDLQNYLNRIGYSEFEVPELNSVYNSKNYIEKPKCSTKFNSLILNNKKDFKICTELIKICIESKLMFKEDILLIKEFSPSDEKKYPSIFTKCNSFILFIVMCTFFTKYCMVAVSILFLWIGYIFVKILYNANKNRKIKNIVLKTIESMKKSSLLIQNSTNFIRECNNLYSSCNDTYVDKNINALMYLLMPELKNVLLIVLQDLINHIMYNISKVRKFFPLKDSISNFVYLYLTECKIDVKNTSLQNINAHKKITHIIYKTINLKSNRGNSLNNFCNKNKARYTYFLLQSELLKQLSLCFCPILWKPDSCSQINHLIDTIQNIEKMYSNSYSVLLEEYNIYFLFKNNYIELNKQPCTDTYINSDLKMKVYTVRQSLQAMMVHIKYMDDLIHNSQKNCIDNLNNTLDILVKESNVFNELISALKIYILKSSQDDKKNKILFSSIEDVKSTEVVESINDNNVCEDELFIGVSEEPIVEADNTFCDEVIFDKSNNYNLMLELNMALKNKQTEWNIRERKLLEKHQIIESIINTNSNEEHNPYTNKIRKEPIDLPPNQNDIIQPNNDFANEIAMIACKWNTPMESFGDVTDSDS